MPYIGKSPSAGVRQRYQYTATAGQTTFSGTDLGNLTLTYTDNNFVDVFQNGVLLKGGTTDYTATSGTSVVLATGASVNDVIEIIVYDVFSAANFYSRTDSDSRYVNHDSGTLGTENFIAGKNAGDSIASGGNYNTLIGNEAGTAINTGDNNTVVGYQAGDAITTGGGNVAIGSGALSSGDTDSNSVAVGYNALASLNVGGNSNVAVGYNALTNNVSGGNNTAIGTNALTSQSTSGGASDTHNTAVGNSAGQSVTSGTENTIVGSQAGDAMTDADRNTVVGYNALTTNTKSDRNTAIGRSALENLNHTSVTSGLNTAVGHGAGSSMTTGIQNTLIGASAGDSIQDAQLAVVVGYNADTNGTGDGNQIVIGNNLTGAGANNVKFGTSGGTATLGLDGSDTSWAAASDLRLKTNVADCAVGLDFIKDLRPITFKWNNKDAIANTLAQYDADSSDPVYGSGKTQHGFIAQEVKTAINAHSGLKNGFTMWSEDPDGTQQVAPSALIPMLTKSIQELSAKNDALEARIKKLEDG